MRCFVVFFDEMACSLSLYCTCSSPYCTTSAFQITCRFMGENLMGSPAFFCFFFASETPKVHCLLPWDKIWKTRNHLFPNPEDSSRQGTCECTHQEHCAVMIKLYFRTVNVLVEIQKRFFANESSVPYLQATCWCGFFSSLMQLLPFVVERVLGRALF